MLGCTSKTVSLLVIWVASAVLSQVNFAIMTAYKALDFWKGIITVTIFFCRRSLAAAVCNYCHNDKKALRETQTLHDGCSKAEPKIFASPQTPFPRWPKFNQLEKVTHLYLQTQFGEDRCMQFRGIMVTDPQTNKQTHKQTGPITIHCGTKLSVQCNYHRCVQDESAMHIRQDVWWIWDTTRATWWLPRCESSERIRSCLAVDWLRSGCAADAETISCQPNRSLHRTSASHASQQPITVK